MKNWKDILVSPSTSIIETIKIIDQTAMQLAIVVDKEQKLLGTVTDGDIRRAILKNVSLESPIETVMNSNPKTGKKRDKLSKIHALIKNESIKHLPIVDENNQVVAVKSVDDIYQHEKKDNIVVLMAGGLGTRLRPLTENIPKPLLKVGSKPILETILESFIEYNFRNFFISVNYKSELIKDYFNSGSKWGINIEYLEELKRLGTAGALSLLSEKPDKPVIVMNGDLLTKVNFDQLLKFHEEHNSAATMCVREYFQQVPYGVIKAKGHRLVAIEEKPTQRYFVNAGIYVLSPEVFECIPQNKFYDMPTLFEVLTQKNYETSVFPIHEYWMDIGQMNDFEKANSDFSGVFE